MEFDPQFCLVPKIRLPANTTLLRSVNTVSPIHYLLSTFELHVDFKSEPEASIVSLSIQALRSSCFKDSCVTMKAPPNLMMFSIFQCLQRMDPLTALIPCPNVFVTCPLRPEKPTQLGNTYIWGLLEKCGLFASWVTLEWG